MRRSLFVLSLLMICFVGTLLAQTDGNSSSVPTPTATLSPRGMEGIFQTLRVNYGLDLDNTSESFPSYVGAETFLQLFARRYLGIEPSMPYAATINIGFMGYDQYQQLISTFSSRAAIGIYQYLMETSGTVFASVGLRKDGFALVYTGRCNNPACNTPREKMQTYQGNVVGLYVAYVPVEIENRDEALDLIFQTYPKLEPLDLMDIGEDMGFTFGVETNREINRRETPIMYYVGAVSFPRYTVVYALVSAGQSLGILAHT